MTGRADGPGAHDRMRLLAAQAVDGWIHPDDAAELEAHLATCPSCRADQRAMLADHTWLATPSRVAAPSSRVRDAVLEAARAPRVPRVGPAPRPWSALAAAGLVVAIVGVGIFLGQSRPSDPGTVGPSGATARPSAAISVPPGTPAAVARGHLVPDNVLALGSLDVDVQVIGTVESGGSASVAITGPFGESWSGRVTSNHYWIDESGPGRTSVAYLEGCKSGTSCEAFHMMVVDGREGDGTFKIEIDFYESLAGIDLERSHPWYRLTSGELAVTGQLPMGATCVPRPASITSHWPMDGDGTDVVGGIDLETQGDAIFGEGLIADGQALHKSTGWAEVPSVPGIQVGAGDFTAMFWVQFDDLIGEQTLIEQWREGPTAEDARGWTLTKLPSNVLVFATSGDAGTGSAQSPPLRKSGWTHLAVRRAGDSLALFVDGEVVAAGTMTTPGVDLRVDTPLLIGRRGDSRGFILHGRVDDVMLAVGTGLTDAEIRATFDATWAGTC